MNSNLSAPVCWRSFPLVPMVIGMCLFIAAAGAGLLALSSCTSSPEAIARQDAVIGTLSNAVTDLRGITPYTPAPAGNFVEPVLGLCTAALAIWSGYLHRNVRVLVKASNGASATAAETPSGGKGNSPAKRPAPG